MDYDASDNRTTLSNGYVSSSFTYDGSNRVTQATDSAGRGVSYTYYPSGELNTVTDAKGGITTLTYDAAHRTTQMATMRG